MNRALRDCCNGRDVYNTEAEICCEDGAHLRKTLAVAGSATILAPRAAATEWFLTGGRTTAATEWFLTGGRTTAATEWF